MIRFLVAILVMSAPFQADAGAWPRPKGEVFVALSSTLSPAPDREYQANSTLYIEYGLTPRLTLGFDGFVDGSGGGEGYAFLRAPVGRGDRRAQLALSVALGQKFTPGGAAVSRLKIGTSWGMGLRRGWLSVDTFAIFSLAQPAAATLKADLKADLTWGQKPTRALMLIWQLQAGRPAAGAAYLRVAPSLVWRLGSKSGPQLELGLVRGVVNDGTTSLKLGLWKTF